MNRNCRSYRCIRTAINLSGFHLLAVSAAKNFPLNFFGLFADIVLRTEFFHPSPLETLYHDHHYKTRNHV